MEYELPSDNERSEFWNKIYDIVSQIPREKTMYDAMDYSSASTELEHLFIHRIEELYEAHEKLKKNLFKSIQEKEAK